MQLDRSGGRHDRRLGVVAALLAMSLLLALSACGSAGGSSGQGASGAAGPTLTLPAQLSGYHIFVSDLQNGDLAELGAQTVHASRSVHGLGVANDRKTLFASDIAGNRLLVYDVQGGMRQQRAVAVGSQPVHMVETRDGQRIFVTNFGGQTVSVVNTTTWTTEREIEVAPSPHAITLSPDGRYAYVACYGGSAVAVLDTATAQRVATIAIDAPSSPYGDNISADGRYLYVSDNETGRLLTFDTATRGLVASLPVGQRPALIARAPDGATLYITNGGSQSLSVVDISTPAKPTLRASISLPGGYPHGVAVTPDGRYVVVANTIGKTLSVVATASNSVVATIQAEQYPNDVAIL